ncbi:MAG: hypothetical protein QCH99_09115 [Candidatus Bathyarchaeota archaeon]|nr:hypothetical protein [Candidatus Bathyarchaeum tardum]WGM90028.1 MAG: hypothetical protein NUK63_02605 [Candidatus Bathyarchaeum tardum]
MGGWSTKGLFLFTIILVWTVTSIITIPCTVCAAPNVPYPLGKWDYISKPVLPVYINASEIEIGEYKTFVYPLEEGKMYRVYCYGEWIDYAPETNKTDYDLFVYNPSGKLESYHTEAAGLPEHLGTTVDHPFFIPEKTGDYSFQIKNDARESNGAQAATLMIIEHIKTDQWYELDMEGKVNDNPVLKTSWGYEFTTNASQIEVIVQVPDSLDMYEARLYIMANPSAGAGTVLNGLPLPIEQGLYGKLSGIYGGYNVNSKGVRIKDAMASCEYPGQDMLINFTAPSQGDILYHLALIAEHGNGKIKFMVKTDFDQPELTIIDNVEKAEPNIGTDINVLIEEQFNLESVTMNYTKDNGEKYSSIEMETEQNQIFTATIPGQPAGTLIEYTVEAKDVGGNIGQISGSYWVKNSENITLDVSSKVVEYGNSITVIGSTRAGKGNVTLYYQLESDFLATTISNKTTEDTTQNETSTDTVISRIATTDASGSFSDVPPLKKGGDWLVWATWNGSETYFGTTSEQESFTILKNYIAVSCNVTSKTVEIGENITITGVTIPRAANLSVNLVFIDQNTTTTKRVITDENGTYTAKWEPTAMGIWQVHANLAENDTLSQAYSNVTTFTVTDTFLNQYFIYIIGGGGGAAAVSAIVFIRKRREDYDD